MHISRRQFVALSAATGVAVMGGRLHARPLAARRAAEFFAWRSAGTHALVALGRTGDDLSLVGGNSVVLTIKGETLLVDTKQAVIAPALRREMQPRAGTLVRVLNTHHHFDHAGGNGSFHADAPLMAHPKAAERIGASREAFLAQLDQKIGALEVSKVEGAQAAAADAKSFRDNLANLPGDALTPKEPWTPQTKLAVGGTPVTLLHYGPGHTDNDLVVHVPSENLLVTGDLVFNGLHPYFDVEGGATITGWLGALKRMRTLCNDKTVVVPGHGDVGGPAIIDTQIAYLNAVHRTVAKAIADGTPREDVVKMTLPDRDAYLLKFAQPFLWGGVFDELSRGKKDDAPKAPAGTPAGA
ncbi:MAG: MBL fold metallo-hydrolase [Planctomycetota bacterium]|nr:MBL fold metallo-hydrolase [Planctomycetota bacterium]